MANKQILQQGEMVTCSKLLFHCRRKARSGQWRCNGARVRMACIETECRAGPGHRSRGMASLIFNPDRLRWEPTLRPGKGPRFPLNRRLDEFHSRSWLFWKRHSLPVQPVASRCADCAVLAPEQNDLRSELIDFAIYTKSEIACEGAAV